MPWLEVSRIAVSVLHYIQSQELRYGRLCAVNGRLRTTAVLASSTSTLQISSSLSSSERIVVYRLHGSCELKSKDLNKARRSGH